MIMSPTVPSREKLDLEEGLLELVNGHHLKKKKRLDLDKYQRVNLRIFEQEVLKAILDECKFKDIGNVYKYPKVLPQPETIGGYGVAADFDLFQRVAVSKKYNSVAFFSVGAWSIDCMFLIDVKKLKKFLGIVNDCLKEDSGTNIFRDSNFNYESNHYIEIMNPVKDDTKIVDVIRKTIVDENLVFDEESTINEVMGDIKTFFKTETEVLYKKLGIPYKRGIILYGDPGNGKSAMIREIIRTIPDVAKIIINPNVLNITTILAALIKALNGKKAMVVIEDLDSLITDRNRSEFLNILDGVDIKSGIYLIGTTNYPDKIDPAFMNRTGRFDRTYPINNPSKKTRRIFFESRNLGDLFGDYNLNASGKGNNKEIIDLFVKYSDNLPMASLKEVITGTAYSLAVDAGITISEAVKKAYKTITKSRDEHAKSHNKFKQKAAMQMQGGFMPYQQMLPNNNIINNVSYAVMDDVEEEPTVKVKMIKVKRV